MSISLFAAATVRLRRGIAVLVAALAPTFCSAQTAAPNVLMICVDDLKPLLGCYGDTHAITPNIDRLAKRAVVFDRAFCNQAVCAPSRNTLMTGLRPQTIGIYDLGTNFRLAAPDAVTVAQYFRQNGYRTEAMGKIMHVGHGNHEDEASWTVPHFKPTGGQYADMDNEPTAEDKAASKKRGDKQGPKGAATESADVADDAYPDGQFATEAVNRLRAAAQKPGEPFFMGVGFLKPHLPFVAPKKYWDLHDPARLPQPERLKAPDGAPAYAPQYGGELRAYKGIPESGTLSPELTRHLIHGYYAATSYTDAQIGKVLDALDETGLAATTIVMLWGDHGWHLGDHGMWCKHTNYEQAARIPFMLALPKAAGAHTQAMIETADIYPTLAQLAGLPAPKGLDGKSFAAVVSNPEQSFRDHVIHVYPRRNMLGRAIRTERYRLVEWKVPGADPSTAEFELYDYQKDPGENRNLAADQPEVVSQLRKLLATHPEAKPQIKAGGTPGGKAPGKAK